MSRRSRWWRAGPIALLLAAGAAALVPGGPDALAPFKVAVAAAANTVYVAVVIDFGPGGPAPVVQCVGVTANSTDSDALAVVVDNQVAYAASGLLCAIDGYPQNGLANCNASSGQDFYFWSYWHGSSGSWQYANDGPAETPVAPGDVEGWRFQNPGPANPSAPAPGPSPAYSAICPASLTVPPTTTTTAVTPPPTTAPSAGSSAAPGAQVSPSTPSGPGDPAAAGGPASKPPSTGTGPAKIATPTTAPSSPGSATTVTTTTTTDPAVRQTKASSKNEDTKPSRQAAALAASRGRQGSGSSWVPFALGAAIVVALVLGAVLVRRRRPESP